MDFVFCSHILDYWNDGKYIFNGEEIIDLTGDPDDYGSIPEEFQIAEFPSQYWHELIDYNNYVSFNIFERLPD